MKARFHFGIIPFIGLGLEKEYHDDQHLICVDLLFCFFAVALGKCDSFFRFWNEVPARFNKKSDKEIYEDIYLFKYKDYTTHLVGRKDSTGFYVQRGDGTRYHYHEDSIEWSKKIMQEKPNG